MNIKRWLIIPAMVIGVVIFALLIKNRSEPNIIPLAETSRVVRTIETPQLTIVPRLVGTGNITPSQIWNGVAQVKGKIIDIHPQLKKGALIKEGEQLLKIDPSDYDLAVAQAETAIEATKAQLAEVKVIA